MSEETLIKQCIYESCTDIKEINKLVAYFKQIQQENQQLKERINMTININRKNKELLSVLDEIREYIVEDIQHCTYGQVPKYQDILQILDKVGNL